MIHVQTVSDKAIVVEDNGHSSPAVLCSEQNCKAASTDAQVRASHENVN